MQEQLRRAGTPASRAIGIDEVSIRKGHTYGIVVSDPERHRPIWFGGQDRSEASMDLFYQWLRVAKKPVLKESFGQAVGLPARGLGTALLRELESGT
jgi:transposase